MKANGIIKSANKNESANLKIQCKGDFVTKGENGGNVNLRNVLCAPEVLRNILSLRKIINSGVGVTLSKQGIRLIDERNRVVKRGPYDGRF